MNPQLQHIKSLIRQGENDRVEFKRKVNHPEKIVREVVAFANSEGGHLLIGVSDNGDMPGLKFPDEEEFVMTRAIQELVTPKIQYQLKKIPITEGEDKAILHYEIFSGKRKPYYAKVNVTDRFGTAYTRVMDKSVQASRELKEILRRGNNKRGTKFYYGDKEKILMEYLEENGQITLSEFRSFAKIPKHLASRKLILLVSANVLDIKPQEKEDIYFMKAHQEDFQR